MDLSVTGGPNYVISSVASGVTPATYGSFSQAAQVTVDTYGRVTAATQNPLPTLASTTLTVAGGPAYTANLTSGIATPGTYGSITEIPQITLDTYGRVTGITNITIPDAGSSYAKMLLYNQTTLSNAITFAPVIPAISGGTAVEVLGSSCSPNGWSFGPSSASSPITMPTSGRLTYTGSSSKTFLVTASYCGNATTSSGIKMEIRKNGSNAGLTNNFYFTGDSGGIAVIPLSVAISMSNGDYVSIFLSRNAASGANTLIYTAQMEMINAN